MSGLTIFILLLLLLLLLVLAGERSPCSGVVLLCVTQKRSNSKSRRGEKELSKACVPTTSFLCPLKFSGSILVARI
jgi:hypothetical protein